MATISTRWRIVETVPHGTAADYNMLKNCTHVESHVQNKIKYQKGWLDGLGTQLGYKQMEDWYHVKTSSMESYNGGKRVLKEYGSAGEAVRSIYNEHHWLRWRFKYSPIPSKYFEESLQQNLLERTATIEYLTLKL